MSKLKNPTCIKCGGESDQRKQIHEVEIVSKSHSFESGNNIMQQVSKTETKYKVLKSHDIGLCNACYEAWVLESKRRSSKTKSSSKGIDIVLQYFTR